MTPEEAKDRFVELEGISLEEVAGISCEETSGAFGGPSGWILLKPKVSAYRAMIRGDPTDGNERRRKTMMLGQVVAWLRDAPPLLRIPRLRSRRVTAAAARGTRPHQDEVLAGNVLSFVRTLAKMLRALAPGLAATPPADGMGDGNASVAAPCCDRAHRDDGAAAPSSTTSARSRPSRAARPQDPTATVRPDFVDRASTAAIVGGSPTPPAVRDASVGRDVATEAPYTAAAVALAEFIAMREPGEVTPNEPSSTMLVYAELLLQEHLRNRRYRRSDIDGLASELEASADLSRTQPSPPSDRGSPPRSSTAALRRVAGILATAFDSTVELYHHAIVERVALFVAGLRLVPLDVRVGEDRGVNFDRLCRHVTKLLYRSPDA